MRAFQQLAIARPVRRTIWRPLSLKPWPLKLWLSLLVVAVVVPLSTLTGFVVWQAQGTVRARAEDQLLHQAKANAIVVDAAFGSVETGLRALAASASLARGDVDAVEAEMRSMARQIGGAAIGLATADGRELLSTTWMPGERRTGAALRPGLVALVASRRTEIDSLAPLPASGQPGIAIVVPVEGPRAGPGLSFHATLPEARLSALLAAADTNNDGATFRVLDRAGAAAAGMWGESGLLAPPLPSLLGGWREAVLRVMSQASGEGNEAAATESLAFARAPRSGYTVVIGVPPEVLQAPLGSAVLQVVALAGAVLTVGGLLAVVLARRFGRELRQATRAEPRLAASLLREADELGRSVAEAEAARNRATAGLAASEQRFRALAESGALVVWRSDAEGAPLESRGWRALTGQSKEEIEGKGWLAAVHPEDRAAAAAAWSGARAAGQPAATEFRVRSGADGGGWRWVRGRGVPVARRAGGGIAEWIGVIEDVHGRREAEKAVAEREARLRLALEAANIATWEYDLARDEGAPLGWPGGATLAPDGEGLQVEGWLGQVHPEDRAKLQAAFRSIKDGSQTPFVAEFRVRRRPPAEGWAWVSSAGAVVERDPATGTPLRIAGISSDITERREAEARRLLVAREVDHRAMNLLAVIQSVLRLTPRDEPEEFAAAVERRIAALARAHNLLAERGWSAADLDAVAAREFGGLPPGAAEMEGPPATLVASAVQPVAMALHELATNSTKHGALSRRDGRVALRWELDRSTDTLRLIWTESGGPPVSAPPSRRGFGSRMIEATVEGQLGGSLALHWREDGLRVEIALPAARVLALQETETETEQMRFALAGGE
jgi:PAS domain S-box-containing protein